MFRNVLIAAIGAGLASAASAQSAGPYECTMSGALRRVEIERESGNAVPCQVVYTKQTEAPGQTQVLWNAQSEAGYCEARLREFVGRLTSLGWSCMERAAAPQNAAEADDTAVLSAPEQ